MIKYTGQLTYHMEMGCYPWPQFHDDRGLNGDKLQYWNWEWTINFDKKTKLANIKIYNKKNEMVYDGPWTYCKVNTSQNNYFTSPKEVPPKEWIKWCAYNFTAIIEAEQIVDALKN